MSHDDFEVEPIKGLPGLLPEGEKLLWQGQPATRTLAIKALHVRKVAIYFAILMGWRFLAGRADGMAVGAALSYASALLPLMLAAMGILWLIALGYHRTTVYSITTRRVMIRSGIALPITVNLPFNRIDSVDLRKAKDGTGDLCLTLNKSDRLAVLVVWPHMRPWHWKEPQPMLRGLEEPERVAQILGQAIRGAAVAPSLLAPAAGPTAEAGAPSATPQPA